MRGAVVLAAGGAETQLGLVSAADRAQQLDSDAFQRITALSLRKLVRLEQGDMEGAERLRRQAEVLSLQQRMPQMFHSFLAFDTFVYTMCNNLAGLTQTIEQLKPLAERYPRWLPVLLQAEGGFQYVRGDYDAARAKFEACIELEGSPAHGKPVNFGLWLSSHARLGECLLALGRAEEARVIVDAAVRECQSRGTALGAFDVIRVLALAESKLGDARGTARLDALIAQQNALGASGLRMGLSYEARTRIALWSDDTEAFERFSELTAREYRHGAHTTLAARFELLMNEAARAGMQPKVTLADYQALTDGSASSLSSDALLTVITRSMASHHTVPERAQVALQMICATWDARVGHMFLLTSAGPVLQASVSNAVPPLELGRRVSDYVSERKQQVEELDDMATGAAVDNAVLGPTVAVEGRSYELLPLCCTVEATSMLVGVAVIERQEGHNRPNQQPELLTALAASLQHADTRGSAP